MAAAHTRVLRGVNQRSGEDVLLDAIVCSTYALGANLRTDRLGSVPRRIPQGGCIRLTSSIAVTFGTKVAAAAEGLRCSWGKDTDLQNAQYFV